MGVNNLLSIIKDTGNNNYNTTYFNKYVVVDAMSLIYRFCIGYRNSGYDILDVNGYNISEIFACLKYTINFTYNPLFS